MNKTEQKNENVYYLETFQKNQIVSKIIKFLKIKNDIIVSDVESFGDSRIFEIRVFSNEPEAKASAKLKETICEIIKMEFPSNYQFDFSSRRLGFTNAFNVFTKDNRFCFECYTRIKEIRKDGSSLMPHAKNQIKL